MLSFAFQSASTIGVILNKPSQDSFRKLGRHAHKYAQRSTMFNSMDRPTTAGFVMQSGERFDNRFHTVSRRQFMRTIVKLSPSVTVAASILFANASKSYAYSSPYRPGQDVTPLPDRLYEKPAELVVTTNTGLKYFDLAKGSGQSVVSDGDTVVVNYTSRLRGLNGIKVDSSFETDHPFVFRVGAGDVVPGVSEAVRGMRVGGKRRAVLPPEIAYRSPDDKPAVTEFFARRRLLSVLETNRDATIVFE